MPAQFTLTLDRTAPAGAAASIAGGVAQIATPTVSLGITTTDPVTTGYLMRIWGDVDPAYDSLVQTTQGASTWVPFSSSRTIKVSGTGGTKTVYVELQDDVGNTASPVSDSVYYLPEIILTDTAEATDALTVFVQYGRTGGDTADATDSTTRIGVLTRPVADTVDATDAVLRALLQARVIADTAGADDAPTSLEILARAISDSALADDAPTRLVVSNRAIADLVDGTDVLTRLGTLIRTVGEHGYAEDTLTNGLANPRGYPLSTGWVAYSGGAGSYTVGPTASDAPAGATGSTEYIFTNPAQNGVEIQASATSTNGLLVKAGQSVSLRMWVRSSVAPTSATLFMRVLQTNGNYITNVVAASTVSNPGTGWVEYTGVARVPDGLTGFPDHRVIPMVGFNYSSAQASITIRSALASAVVAGSLQPYFDTTYTTLARSILSWRASADTASADDALVRFVTNGRALSDAVTGSDALTRLYHAIKFLTDTVSGIDSIFRIESGRIPTFAEFDSHVAVALLDVLEAVAALDPLEARIALDILDWDATLDSQERRATADPYETLVGLYG